MRNRKLIGFLNYWLIQLFFFRVTMYMDKNNNIEALGIMYFVVPFTGWNTNFKTIGKQRFKRF